MIHSAARSRLAGLRSVLPLGIVLLCAGTVHAHPGHSGHEGSGIGWGLLHPLTGVDHLVAMIAVGLWAVQLGGRARWALPLAFVAAMGGGATLAMLGVALPLIEPMVLASVIALAALGALAVRMPLGTSLAIVAASAFFHGQAHGAELPAGANGWLTALGFLATTAVLHGVGMLGGLALQRLAKARAARAAGPAA